MQCSMRCGNLIFILEIILYESIFYIYAIPIAIIIYLIILAILVESVDCAN